MSRNIRLGLIYSGEWIRCPDTFCHLSPRVTNYCTFFSPFSVYLWQPIACYLKFIVLGNSDEQGQQVYKMQLNADLRLCTLTFNIRKLLHILMSLLEVLWRMS
jgi:hypothetical protein